MKLDLRFRFAARNAVAAYEVGGQSERSQDGDRDVRKIAADSCARLEDLQGIECGGRVQVIVKTTFGERRQIANALVDR